MKNHRLNNRQTNIELLRIISMFMVLIVHSDFLALGVPNINDYNISPLNAFTRSFIESLSIVCVNIFILISGWFGIKASIKGLFSFLFQCIYFSVGIYILSVILGNQLSVPKLIGCMLFSSYWFIPAYLALYILSPILNYFLANNNKKRIGIILIILYLFQTIYGLSGIAKFIEFGYSAFSFILLYILSRYINISIGSFSKSKFYYFFLYLLFSFFLTFFNYIELKMNCNFNTYAYINPIIILSSVSIFIFFIKLQIKNMKIVNSIASSSFAVFLLHLHKEYGLDYFVNFVNYIYISFNGLIVLLLIFCLLMTIFAMAVIIDQPRKLLWIIISNVLSKYKWYSVDL